MADKAPILWCRISNGAGGEGEGEEGKGKREALLSAWDLFGARGYERQIK